MKKIVYFSLLLVLFSCKKEKDPEIIVADDLKNGILVLNEGLFQLNNSNLSWINLADLSITNDFFEQKVGRKLGDTGNDMKRYGNKIYIVVNVSSTVEILDAKTGKSIKQIIFLNGTEGKQPRNISFFGSKAFVSCFDGFVDVIDTASLEIEKRIQVGLNPDQLISSNSRIFVSNSGGLNNPVYDSTLSIINPQTLLEESKIVVGKNPGGLEIVGNNLFVTVRGNFGSIPTTLKRINLSTLQIEETYSFKPIILEKMNTNLLLAYDENQVVKVGVFDVLTNSFSNANLIDLSTIQTLYGIHYESSTNRIYLTDSKDYTTSGKVLEYAVDGSFIRSFSVGLNPNSLLFF
ncbi:MAG: YncE family protein [Bacteroidota bacterium]